MKEPVIPQLDGPQFLAWEQAQTARFELHRGFVMAFAGGTAAHAQIAFNLQSLLGRAFGDCRAFGSDVKVKVAEDIFYYADVAVVCGEAVDDEATVLTGATVACEVLSRGTRAYDLVERRAAYRGLATLNAYVIVHTDRRRVEVDERNRDGAWQTLTFDDAAFDVHGRTLPFDALYERTSIE